MPRYRDEPVAVRVYTVCDESKYLIVRNVPSLACGEELKRLFESYGPVEECKPMDAEDCEPYTDVFFIKFSQSCIMQEKTGFGKLLLKYRHFKFGTGISWYYSCNASLVPGYVAIAGSGPQAKNWSSNKRGYGNASVGSRTDMVYDHVSSNKDYFSSESMNATVNLVRDKLEKIESSSNSSDRLMASKKAKVRLKTKNIMDLVTF